MKVSVLLSNFSRPDAVPTHRLPLLSSYRAVMSRFQREEPSVVVYTLTSFSDAPYSLSPPWVPTQRLPFPSRRMAVTLSAGKIRSPLEKRGCRTVALSGS